HSDICNYAPRQSPRMVRPRRISAPLLSKSDALMDQPDTHRRAGDTRAALNANRGTLMNAIRPEKVEATETETVDSNLAAVTEVEAGIRDFVRNDIAYLRRPAASAEPALDASA